MQDVFSHTRGTIRVGLSRNLLVTSIDLDKPLYPVQHVDERAHVRLEVCAALQVPSVTYDRT